MSADQKPLTHVVRDAIDQGVTTVEEIHKAIADLPLKLLEDREFLRGPVEGVRRVQDSAIGGIYELIRAVNRQIATFVSELLADTTTRTTRRDGAAARLHATPGAAAS
jgi:hypothetical protein